MSATLSSERMQVYVTRRVPERVRAELAASFELRYHDSEEPPSRAALLDGVRGMDGVVTMLTDRVDDELLDAAGPSLRVVANYAVGYDNVDVEACARRGIVVANTPDVLTKATAELTIALVLALLRRVAEGDRFLRRREPWIWAPTFMLGTGLEGKRLGLVGLGRIGLEVARLGAALGMRVAYTSRRPRSDLPYEALPLSDLLARADVVSIHTPLTAETHHLIGRRELALMRPSAVLVNTARGPVVDEEALADALAAGTIAGAALDVFEREPEVCDRLLALENVVLCPHLGSATLETREAMGLLCVSALRAVLLEGREPANAVTPRKS
jgi:glyoxylate reductase